MPYLQQLQQDGDTVFLTPNGGGTIQLRGVVPVASVTTAGALSSIAPAIQAFDFAALGLPTGLYTCSSVLTYLLVGNYTCTAVVYWDAILGLVSASGSQTSIIGLSAKIGSSSAFGIPVAPNLLIEWTSPTPFSAPIPYTLLTTIYG
jgi:hypothetical protein